ncbi:MAG: helix-turn-helix transcriptional regulator [Bacillota bacterium]
MNNLYNLRTGSKLNQREVANVLGITYQAYAHYETGRRQPSPEQLILLADFFNVSVDHLLGRENKEVIERTEQRPALTKQEHELFIAFNTLNAIGKIKAMAYIQGLQTSKEFIN